MRFTSSEMAGFVGFGLGFGYTYNKNYNPNDTLFGIDTDAALLGVFTGAIGYMLAMVATEVIL